MNNFISTKHIIRNFIFLGIVTGLALALYLTIESPASLFDELILFCLVLGLGTGIGALGGWVCRKILDHMSRRQ
jgi:NhaP-type Na+/H+ or K+/H+ antiporter